MSKHFPDIRAVDPYDCGCTECIVHEYEPEGTWADLAQPEDVIALLTGEVRNNTYSPNPVQLVLSSTFKQEATREFVYHFEREFWEAAARDVEAMDFSNLLYLVR